MQASYPPALVHPSIMIGAGAMLTPAFIKQHSITHVINCAYPEDSPSWFQVEHPQEYACIEAEDGLDSSILKWYPKFKHILTTFLQKRGRIFVHCQCGINRAPYLTLTYVCDVFGYPYDVTRRAIRQQRSCAFRNTAFESEVHKFVTKKKD